MKKENKEQDYLGYTTYSLGTTKNILNCLEIILYNRLDINSEKISLFNMNNVFKEVISKNKYLRLNRENQSISFYYDKNNGKIDGFNVILYLNNSTKTPIGYTEFINIQGTYRDISISFNFTSNVNNELIVNLSNSLISLRNNSTTSKSFLGENLNNYTDKKTINEYINKLEPFSRYSTHIHSLISSNKEQINFLRNGSILNSGNQVKLGLSKNLILDPLTIGFSNYTLGIYNLDLVINIWTDNKYNIYSLTKVSKFNNPISYTKNNSEYEVVPEGYTIKDFLGRYIKLEKNNIDYFFDTISKKILNLDSINNNIFIDKLDLKNKLIILPKNLNKNTVYNYYPEIVNTYLDIDEYSKFNLIDVINKIGKWYVIKQKITYSNKLIIIYSNLTSTVYTSEEDSVFLLNDNTLIVKTIDTNYFIFKEREKISLEYYTFYSGIEKTYYTEKARSIISKSPMIYNEELGILFCKTDTEEDSIYLDYYKNKELNLVFKNEKLTDSYLNNYKRQLFVVNDLYIPDIIDTIFGVIYYKYNNKIDYL